MPRINSGYLTGKYGVTVRYVSRGSSFFRGGVREGDRIVAINGEPLFSELDFHYFAADHLLQVEIKRRHTTLEVEVERLEGDFTGVELVEQPIQRCTNRCVFCFIDQMPPGLRKSLYIKDEDIRLSLVNGNYVTMSNFSQQDLENIVRIGLSPLYISVHTTNTGLRCRMLRNRKCPSVMEQLAFLAEYGTRFHTQIVVCPSYNDGDELKKTVRDLQRLGDALLSVAVVPVGLTRFRKIFLPPVDRKTALSACRMISRISDRSAVKDGFRKIFLSDEFFIKAQLPIPELEYYEDFPQIENGVGLVRQLFSSWNCTKSELRRRRNRSGRKIKGKRILVGTSVSAYPYIEEICKEIRVCFSDTTIEVLPVINRFFGESVTVAGLLTASDIISEIKKKIRYVSFDEVVLPSVILNFAGYTLDGFSSARMEKTAGISLRLVNSIEELIFG